MSDQPKAREVFFEYTRLEDNLRVCAVDSVTGIEIVTVLPAKTTETEAQNIALKKLIWRLEKDQQEQEGESRSAQPDGKYL